MPKSTSPRRASLLAVLVGLLVTLAGCVAQELRQGMPEEAGHLTVRTASGLLRGKVAENGSVAIFRGVPYAAPPVAERRWKAPQPPLAWQGVRDALAPGSPCPQSGRLASTNEDCLVLDVWTPHRTRAGNLPVMVFLHGGGQRQSAAHEYNADWLVTRGAPVVYVGINYRLNIFAFFAHAALTAEEPQLGSGNYAALDQMQALRWVRDNIASFGGDPENVTIFGESGGGQAVCVLLVSPPARGLFHRAITQSAPCQWQYYPSLTASEERGALTAAELGCGDADPLPCLRALPASAILAKERGAQTDTAGAQPSWGGGVFPLPMRESVAAGALARVPLMQGSNLDEAMFLLSARFGSGKEPMTAQQYPGLIAQFLGASRVAAVQRQYPLSKFPEPIDALSAVLTDSGMATNNRIGLCNLHLANELAAPHVPLYAYVFADRSAPYPAPIFEAPGGHRDAAHTKELSYLFHQRELTPAQRRVSDAMIGYWTRFAATGDPNAGGLPPWPRYQAAAPAVMKFGDERIAADTALYAQSKCRFWAEQGFGLLSGPYPGVGQTGPDFK